MDRTKLQRFNNSISSLPPRTARISQARSFNDTREVLPPVDTLNMDQIIRSVCSDLQPLFDETAAKLTIATDWPKVLGYAPWVERVWSIYISNAIVSCAKQPNIKLGWTYQPCHHGAFWVDDNGIYNRSMEEAAAFSAPSSCNCKRKGLDIVENLIGRLGGEVGAFGKSEVGYTFFFTLPLPDG